MANRISSFRLLHGVKVADFNGRIYPPFWPRHLSAAGWSEEKLLDRPSDWSEWMQEWMQFKPRHDDIIISSYPKSGHHWANEFVTMLWRGTTKSPNIPKVRLFVELRSMAELEALRSPRTLLTHLAYDEMPQAVLDHSKLIYIYRNPKDVAVSYYYHMKDQDKSYQYSGTWDEFFEMYLSGEQEYGSWFDSVIPWWNNCRQKANVLFLSYEDLKQNFKLNSKTIANYLGKEYPERFYDDLEKTCDISAMRSNTKIDGSISLRSDETTSMFRKGIVGDWQMHFTPEQNARFDKLYHNRMRECDIPIQFTLDDRCVARL